MTATQFDENEPDPQVDPEDDFLRFWAEHEQAETGPEIKRILGVDVEVPRDLPMKFEKLAEALDGSSDIEDIKRLLVMLFGRDVLDEWIDNGVTNRQFRLLFTWGVANGQGAPTTFEEAADLLRQAEKADAEGKAPKNRAARRASFKTGGSAGSGGASKRISRASTGTRRKK